MTNKVLQTTEPVILNAQDVQINLIGVNELAKKWALQNISAPLWSEDFYLKGLAESDYLNYLFVIDALNFCFWPDKNKKRWEIKYQGHWHRGASALAAALKRAYENNVPIADFRYLRRIKIEEVKSIFSGKGKIPLLKERWEILRDSAERMLCRYDGQAENLIADSRNSALKLVYKLAKEFPSFNDQAVYNGKRIWFLKRAQLLAADIWGGFSGRGIGRFDDIDKLTAFADYRVPQVLEYLGILEYSPSLKEKIQNQELLPAGSREEIEIRAVMIWAIERLKQALQSRQKNLNTIQIDRLLWILGQELKQKPDSLPHHRTKTIYY